MSESTRQTCTSNAKVSEEKKKYSKNLTINMLCSNEISKIMCLNFRISF